MRCAPASRPARSRGHRRFGRWKSSRSWSATGAARYVSFDGTMDTCITLRTMVVKEGIVSMQAGAGIVADSDPGREYEECFHKLGGNLRAVALAEDLVNDEGGD